VQKPGYPALELCCSRGEAKFSLRELEGGRSTRPPTFTFLFMFHLILVNGGIPRGVFLFTPGAFAQLLKRVLLTQAFFPRFRSPFLSEVDPSGTRHMSNLFLREFSPGPMNRLLSLSRPPNARGLPRYTADQPYNFGCPVRRAAGHLSKVGGQIEGPFVFLCSAAAHRSLFLFLVGGLASDRWGLFPRLGIFPRTDCPIRHDG